MGVSNYYSDAILDSIFDSDALPVPAVSFFVALCLTQPALGDTGTQVQAKEVIYTNYARTALSLTTGFGTSADGTILNTEAVTFPIVGTTGSAAIGWWAILDLLDDGNLYFWGTVTSTPTLSEDDVPILSIGDISITLT